MIAAGPQGMRFTLTQPWSALLLDDERVIHETTPILDERDKRIAQLEAELARRYPGT